MKSSLFVLIFVLEFIHGSKILFFCPVPAHSHQKMYKEVWKEMSLKGHEVYVVTPIPDFNKSMTNLFEYDISSTYEFERNQIKPEWKEAFYRKPTFLSSIVRELIIQAIGGDGWEFLFKHPEVKRLLKEHKHFDVCLLEWFHPTIAVFGHLFGCPFIGLGSNSLPVVMTDAVGNINHPIAAPEQDLPIPRDKVSFFQRVWSTFWAVFVRLHHKYLLLPEEDARIKKHFGKHLPYLGNLERNMSLILINRNHVFHRPVAYVPNVIELGAIKYKKSQQIVPKDLKSFLDAAKQGVVYFSLGISMQGTTMPRKYLQILQNTFKQLPFKVVWKWENSTMPDKPDNVFISKFLPQVEILVLFSSTTGAKILFLSCTPAPSHQKPFQILWKALSIKGHDVHVLSPNPLNDPNLTNLTEYDLSDFYGIIKQTNQENIKYLLHKPTFLSAFVKDVFATKLFSNLYKRTLNHKETKRLLKDNHHFDAVIVEWLFPTLAAIGAYYKAPIIGITSLGAPMVALDTLGNPSHPIAAPDMNLPLKRSLSFKERLLSVIYALYVRIYYKFVVLPREDVNVKNYLSSDLPYLGLIERNVSALLMNRNPVFHRAVPLFPNTVDLGKLKEFSEKTPLDYELGKFVEQSKNGVIYFSLGTSMKSVLLDDAIIKTIQNVFSNLPYDFVWKWEDDNMTGKPVNVYISSWIPQVSLLEHPNVKLFITQGGLQSTEEAIAAHKPILGIPFHSDQTTNVDTCVMYGMGKMLDLEDISEDKLKDYILEIMNDPSYARNAKKLDELMKDQPQDGLEKAIWWIEYVIRHKGAKHLRNIAVDLPWWQYLMLDVIGFILAIIFLILLIPYFVLKLLFKAIFRKSNLNSQAKKKKQ